MIGTHNSLTYAKPKSKWAHLIRFIWRNQTSSLKQQIAKGAKAFDIRFAPVRGGWAAAHGAVTLDISPVAAIRYIDSHCRGAYVRVILEKGDERSFDAFRDVCRYLDAEFPNITFWGGNYKPTWKRLYEFNRPNSAKAENLLYQHIGSMQSKWGKIFPQLWARMHKQLPAFANGEDMPIVFVDML